MNQKEFSPRIKKAATAIGKLIFALAFWLLVWILVSSRIESDLIFPSPKAPAGWLYGHLASMYAFLCAASTGTDFEPSIKTGAYVQAVMDAAYRSADQDSRMTEVEKCW